MFFKVPPWMPTPRGGGMTAVFMVLFLRLLDTRLRGHGAVFIVFCLNKTPACAEGVLFNDHADVDSGLRRNGAVFLEVPTIDIR